MRVLGIVGSPRKNGNTDKLVDKILEGAQSCGAEVEKIILADLNINGCRGCNGCMPNLDDPCVQDDDMQKVIPKLIEAEALVLGSPVYWFGPSAQFKAFIDRWYSLADSRYNHKLRGKKAVLATAFGDSDPMAAGADLLVRMMREVFDFVGIEWKGKVFGSAMRRGEIAKNEEVMKQAFLLGIQLCK